MVNRRLLRWGVFLLAVGAVLLIAQSEGVDRELVRQAMGLWPLVLIGFGAALLLRRTRLALASSVLAAAMPGLLLGGLVVAVPEMTPDCRLSPPAGFETREGSFQDAGSVDLTLACGELTVSTSPGSGWQVRTGQDGGRAPRVEASADRLTVSTADQRSRFGGRWGGDTIQVSLPADRSLDLAAQVNAGRGRFDLVNARLGRVNLEVNAGESTVDLTGATLSRLVLRVNAAGATVQLPAADFTADLDVNAGELEVCLPADLGLRIRSDVNLGSIEHPGFVGAGDTWETANYASATHHADVTISVNVGSVDINPAGGCK